MKVAWLIAAIFVAGLPAQKVTLPSEPIVFGEAFELTITTAQPFDQARLLPLTVELLSRESQGNTEQLRFRARCYELGEVTLPLEPPQTLQVASCLPDPAGVLEWPGDGWWIEPSEGSHWVLFTSFALLAVAVCIWWRVRRKPIEESEGLQPVAPTWDALAALRELAGEGAAGEAFYLQLKAIVRKHCAVRFHLPADVRTSEELLQALPKARATLQPCLMTCDVVLFGGAAAAGIHDDVANRDGARNHAIQFVKATQVAARSLEVGA